MEHRALLPTTIAVRKRYALSEQPTHASARRFRRVPLRCFHALSSAQGFSQARFRDIENGYAASGRRARARVRDDNRLALGRVARSDLRREREEAPGVVDEDAAQRALAHA